MFWNFKGLKHESSDHTILNYICLCIGIMFTDIPTAEHPLHWGSEWKYTECVWPQSK